MKLVKDSRLIISLVFVLSVFIFIITGCSTTPDFAEKNYPGVVVEDGRLLLYFNLSKDRELLDNFMSRYSENDLSPIIKRTDRLSFSVAGLDPESNFSILAEGKYSKFFTNYAIGKDKNWEKHKDDYIWWEYKEYSLFASVPLKSVAIISSTDIDTNLEFIDSGSRNFIPEKVKTEFEQSAITVYSHLPGAAIYKSLNIPLEKMLVQNLFFVVKKIEDNYSISGVLDFSNNFDAKIFSIALKLGLLMKMNDTGKSAIMKVVHTSEINAVDNQIIINNILLDSNEMMTLLAGN